MGTLTGLFGVGGGFLIIAALVIGLRVPMPIAAGTSLPIIVVNCAAGLVPHLQRMQVDGRATAAAITAIPVAMIASVLGARRENRSLHKGFACLTPAVAGFVLIDTFRG